MRLGQFFKNNKIKYLGYNDLNISSKLYQSVSRDVYNEFKKQYMLTDEETVPTGFKQRAVWVPESTYIIKFLILLLN